MFGTWNDLVYANQWITCRWTQYYKCDIESNKKIGPCYTAMGNGISIDQLQYM